MQGLQAFWNTFTAPDANPRGRSTIERAQIYSHAWSYYESKMFGHHCSWFDYLTTRGLYSHTKLLVNPVPLIVDFYVDHIWEGIGQDRDNAALVTPLLDETDAALVNGVAQIDQWSNWLSASHLVKRYAAGTGNVLIEAIDDLTREKVTHKTNWPGRVHELELSDSGDVLSYVLEYPVYDYKLKETYQYRKEVTRETFKYFRDDAAFTPDGKTDSVEPNNYGFCPAVWIKHDDLGGDYGYPAVKNFDKIDKANSSFSHTFDFIDKAIESPKLISTGGEIIPISGAGYDPKTKIVTPVDPRLSWMVLKTEAGANVLDLSGSLKLAEAHPYLKDLVLAFSDDYPELQAQTIIKQNTQLSGTALERMMTPAQKRLDRAAANYNQQLIKLRQMQLAIAGWRTRNGWNNLTDQQKNFADFDLESYESGKLDFNLKRSLLIGESEAEREELLSLKADRADKLAAQIGEMEYLRIAGYSDDEAKRVIQEKDKEAANRNADNATNLDNLNNQNNSNGNQAIGTGANLQMLNAAPPALPPLPTNTSGN